MGINLGGRGFECQQRVPERDPKFMEPAQLSLITGPRNGRREVRLEKVVPESGTT